MKFEVTTSVENDRITSAVDAYFDDIKERITTTVIDTREQQVRSALIALGWTPPSKEAK